MRFRCSLPLEAIHLKQNRSERTQTTSRQHRSRSRPRRSGNVRRKLRQKQSGVDAAVERINARLANLGVHTFKITRLGPERPLYTLERPGQGKSETRSLSEGERTLIAFLYYLELLRGAEVADVEYPIRRTIAVVDDPISSLSHNHIYDIAALIHHELVLPAQRQTELVRFLFLRTTCSFCTSY